MSSEITSSRPTLIKIGMFVSPIWGCVLVVVAVIQSIGSPDAEPLVGRPRGTWSFALWNAGLLLAGFVLMAIGYALWKELPWARPTALLFWSLQALLALSATVLTVGRQFVSPIGRARGCSCDFTWIVGLVLTWWYFYRKANVVEYYLNLEKRARV